jgi:hypothetical protein
LSEIFETHFIQEEKFSKKALLSKQKKKKFLK